MNKLYTKKTLFSSLSKIRKEIQKRSYTEEEISAMLGRLESFWYWFEDLED